MMIMGAVISFAVTLCGALLLFECGARRVYDYAVSPEELVVRLFGRFQIYRIALTDIVDADLWTFSFRQPAALFATLRIGNRIFGRAVVIKRRSGFPRFVVVTPDDPQNMVAKLRATIGRDGEARPPMFT